MMLDVLAVTGSRADWGLLAPVLALLRDAQDFRLRLAVTGQHLMRDVASRDEIRADGFAIDHEIDLGLDADDSPLAIARATARAVTGLGELLAVARPQLIILLGDRYEIFAAATAALFARVPVAHLCGGDITEGALDDAMRHCVTKLSHLHFVSNAESARRVEQLGEHPATIFTVGSPGLDRIRQIPLMQREAFFAETGLVPQRRNVIVNFHSATLAADSLDQCRALLGALDELTDVGILLTGSNADAEGRQIDVLLKAFAAERPHAVFHGSLGSRRYFSALAHVDAVVGNSSSGLCEAPSFGVPTVNIGERQKGRLRAASVIDCPPCGADIRTAIEKAFALGCTAIENPYGDGQAAQRIVGVLRKVEHPSRLIQKRFSDYGAKTSGLPPQYLGSDR